MKIGVSGASGHLGSAVVSELLQRADGHEVVNSWRKADIGLPASSRAAIRLLPTNVDRPISHSCRLAADCK
jgi:uncharacterized protein YbjT (DUF2867 family)